MSTINVISSNSSSDHDVEETENPYFPDQRPPDYLILCKTCLKNRVEVIFIPCHHACLCEECYDKLPTPLQCPICHTNIFRTYPVKIEI